MRNRSLLIVAVLLGVLAVGWWSMRDRGPQQPVAATEASAELRQQSEASQTAAPAPAKAPVPASAVPSQSNPPLDDSPVDVAERGEFNEAVRKFFAQAPDMALEDRQREAEKIRRELARLERAGGMSAGETFLIRAGLIRETVPDKNQQAAEIDALKQRYENDSAQRQAQKQAQPDPVFEQYKAREREIVQQVMAMETIPGGKTREEYLRERLQQERERLMGAPRP